MPNGFFDQDDTVKALLEACGPVKSWKRMTDPETNQPKVSMPMPAPHHIDTVKLNVWTSQRKQAQQHLMLT